MKPHACKFCGKEFAQVKLHSRRCPLRPELYAVQRAALDDGTGRIMTIEAYERTHTAGACAKHLREYWGGWDAVAAGYSLQPTGNKAGRPVVKRAESPARAATIEAIGHDNDHGQARRWALRHYDPGLTVCRVIETPTETRYVLR